jgi:IS30 family transposase
MLPGMPKSERIRKQKRERIHGRVMIDERPALVETRGRTGDREGDTIRPVAGSQTGLLTLVERKTRVVRMTSFFCRRFRTLPRNLIASCVQHRCITSCRCCELRRTQPDLSS